jgi:hypothetical protein
VPEDQNSTAVSCGRTLTPSVISWVTSEANIRVLPVSEPCIARVQPLAKNPGFEFPMLCEGSKNCDPAVNFDLCAGVLLALNIPNFGWVVQGRAGVTFAGLQGIGKAPERNQNLYLIPEFNSPVILTQTIDSFIVGADYKITFFAGTPTIPNIEGDSQLFNFSLYSRSLKDIDVYLTGSFLGIYFNLSSPVGFSSLPQKPLWSPSFYQSSTFTTETNGNCRIWYINQVQSKGSIDFDSLESSRFTADRY